MNRAEVITWLKAGDPVIEYLTDKYLLDLAPQFCTTGYISRYLENYNLSTNEWGGGIYSPLWISSHYTLLELKYMEVDCHHPYIQDGTKKLLNGLWFDHGRVSKRRYQDMCMSAMLLSVVSFAKLDDDRLNEIVDYILSHQMSDGGWNCAWDSSTRRSTKSSFHTTISVLEALSDFKRYGYHYRLQEINQSITAAEEYLLTRRLLYSLSKDKIADLEFTQFHYPVRYRYDCFRALEYFVDANHPYDERMNEALHLIKVKIKDGPIPVGKQYSGKIHFRLEKTKDGRFNTFRALKILKAYDHDFYSSL